MTLADNEQHRALFALPPISVSAPNALIVPDPPPAPEHVTGDIDVDTVLWLRKIIDTGDSALIEKALQAAERIKTPIKVIEERYKAHLMRANGGSIFATFDAFDMGDFKGRAKEAIERRKNKAEAIARFGSERALFEDTPAETFAAKALRGTKKHRDDFGQVPDGIADAKFQRHPELLPSTLADCLAELHYWEELWRLRHPFGASDSTTEEGYARKDFAFRCMARIPPRYADEALQVLDFMVTHDLMDREETNDILRNLIRGPRDAKPISATPYMVYALDRCIESQKALAEQIDRVNAGDPYASLSVHDDLETLGELRVVITGTAQ